MASLEASERAITALNNSTPPGAVQSLIVRFAESAAEKAARLSRREAKSLQRMRVVPNGMHSGSPFDGMAGGLGPDHLQQALSALSLGGMPQAAALRSQLPPPPLVPQAYQPQMLSSICIKGERSGGARSRGCTAAVDAPEPGLLCLRGSVMVVATEAGRAPPWPALNRPATPTVLLLPLSYLHLLPLGPLHLKPRPPPRHAPQRRPPVGV